MLPYSKIVTDEMESIKEGASITLKKIVELETTRVYSSNTDFLRERDQWLHRYQYVTLSETQYHITVRHSPHPWKTVPDYYLSSYEDEMHLMAKVRAYFEVAYKVA